MYKYIGVKRSRKTFTRHVFENVLATMDDLVVPKLILSLVARTTSVTVTVL